MSAENERRAEFIAGLRAAADYLDGHPEIPLDDHATVDIAYNPQLGDAERLAEVRRVAALLGVDTQSLGSHVLATKRFGPVRYQAVYIPQRDQQDWAELMKIREEQRKAASGDAAGGGSDG